MDTNATPFDVIAIGAGSGGLAIGIGGAALGLRVALIERARIGGECLWTGCVPSKALLHAAALARAAQQVAQWNGTGSSAPRLDFGSVVRHVHAARTAIEPQDSKEALEQRGIAVFHGTPRLVAPGVVALGDRQLRGRHIVLATGSRPIVPPIPGLAAAGYCTNETVFDQLTALPERLVVIGGGPIGVELAQAFGRLGSRVTILQKGTHLLPREEAAVSQAVQTCLEAEGVTVQVEVAVKKVVPAASGGPHRVVWRSASGDHLEVVADRIIVATGRRPNVAGLDLAAVGVAVDRGGVRVDPYLRTTARGIWACGDVIGGYLFTHVAEAEARVILRNIMFPWVMQKMDYSVVPWTTFTDPEVGRVGLTEQAARDRYGQVTVEHFPLAHTDRAVADGASAGFIKLVLRGQRIIGAHIVAPRAGELTQQVALMMRHKLPLSTLSMIHVYPTYSYALHEAADAALLTRLAQSRFSRWFYAILRALSRR